MLKVLDQLAHPVVRDLAWAVFSDDLILAESISSPPDRLQRCALSQLTPAREAWLLKLDSSPQALLDHVGTHREGRLGLYFESLWHFFLDSDPGAALLAHNLPVRDGGQTVGEFDCLYRCYDSGQIVHLELAVKFYLHTGAGTGGSGDGRADWLGPGRQDRLDRKLDHLAKHQTRLADHPAAQHLLDARGLMPERREVVVKGRLFSRPDRQCLPPRGFNPVHTLCAWVHIHALNTLDIDKDTRFLAILPRQHWLSPLASAAPCRENAQKTLLPGEGPDLLKALKERFAAARSPLLVASLDADRQELRRFFVAPTGWPGQARS